MGINWASFSLKLLRAAKLWCKPNNSSSDKLIITAGSDIFIGVNAVDYSGYPDCRPDYITAYEAMAGLATKAGVEGNPISIQTPLIDLSKADIIRKGVALGVDYSLTVSCYQADSDGRACGRCDSCFLRKEGFESAALSDPTRYQ